MALTGKQIVVTGGSRGIGRGIVQKLLERQNQVIATTRGAPGDAAQLRELAAEHGGRLVVTQLDTGDPASVRAWAAGLKQHTQHVDVLVNNAGVYGRRLGLQEFEPEDFALCFNVNCVGPFLVVQQLLKQGLLGPPGGSLVVNVTSIMASHGDQTVSSVTPGGYAYRASKAALNITNKALALDLADQGVRCVLVHPGYVRTDLTGGAGWIDVEESSGGIVRLLEGRSADDLNGRFFAYSGDEIPW